MKVFISYSRLDDDLGNAVYDYLTTTGYEVFIDTKKIGAGEWDNVIKEYILSCDIFVVIITHSSILREQVKKELFLAQDKRKIIIPCIDKDVERKEIPWELNKYNQVNFEDRSDIGRNVNKMIKLEEKKLFKNENSSNSIYNEQDTKENERIGSNSEVDHLNDKGSYLIDKGKYRDAIECFDKSTKIDPNNALAWFNKGIALAKIGKNNDAIESFDKSTKIDPNNALAWRNQGFAYKRIGDDYESKKCYEKAQKLEKENQPRSKSLFSKFKRNSK